MFSWLLPLALALLLLALLLKLHLLRRDLDALAAQLAQRMDQDSNNPLFLPSRDPALRRLAVVLDRQLRQLRQTRLRYENGDRELKAAITNISHDLRTPLTAILGYLDLLDYVEKPEQIERYLSMIRNRSEMLRQQTEELFGYSIVKSVSEETSELLSLNHMLEESLASYYGALTGQGITPEISIPAPAVMRRLNRSSLNRIFGNIINNALKYSDGDFSVSMTANGIIVFSNRSKALTPVTAGRLFDRFYTVESGRHSTGLGLSIARLLTEQMNGKISADYRDGRLFITLSFPEF